MNKSQKRHYWLGGDTVKEQDTFFLEALDSTLWSPGTKDKWDTCWNVDMPERAMFKKLDATKTINHTPGNNALTIKSNLHQTLTKAKQRVAGLPQEQRYSFYPDTYSMPEDYFKFQEVAAENPDWIWIQKPRNLSRGRGIEVVKHPEMVPMDDEWIVQRYLSDPHLWDGYKYALRCYVLITSVEPLRFYWYHEGFAKKTSEPYSKDDLDNPYRHLTNPDINEHNTDVDVPVVFHSFDTYRKWLKSEGIDDVKLFDQLQDLIALTVIAARESFRTQSQSVGADTQGAYELIGLDCMVDNNLKPWILECNLSPSLETCSSSEGISQEETTIKRQLVHDIVNIIGLNEPVSSITLNDQQKAAAELSRSGGFQCVFPADNANEYLNCFPVPRYADIASLPKNVEIDYTKIPLQAPEGVEAVFADSLALLHGSNVNGEAQFMFPNELATLIWLQNSAGLRPDEIAKELSEVYESNDAHANLTQIWDVLADWSQANLFVANNDPQSPLTSSNKTQDWMAELEVDVAGVPLVIKSACPVAGAYILPFFQQYQVKKKRSSALSIDILRSNYGYVLTSGANVIAGSQKLSALIPQILKLVAKHCLSDNEIAVLRGVVASIDGTNTLIISNSEKIDALVYQHIDTHSNMHIVSGDPVLGHEKNKIRCTDFPLYLSNGSEYPSNEKGFAIERNGEKYQLQSLAIACDSTVTINRVINLQAINSKDVVCNEETIQTLRNAEVLAKLWDNCLHKKPQAAISLPLWLDGIQGLNINVLDDESIKTNLASSLSQLLS